MDQPDRHFSKLTPYTHRVFAGDLAEQVGALCYRKSLRGIDILLITTRQTKRWTIPKGWPCANLKAYQAAEREAWEEAGVRGKIRKKTFGHYTYTKYLKDNEHVTSIVGVYLLEVRRERLKFPEQDQRDLIWRHPREAAVLVQEPELKGLILKLGRKWKASARSVA
ncbi:MULTISPECIES: NUDIX domain-containing protein [unclassified Rhizobium]|jgi:8-oxo-dGTP pyrophosphatase MutT (NUDIX family)|uniref:NUDIX hydrolase n=1 Tax=unclassified Rhizobium TaxID=2613769 RepID=UPI00146AF7B5|nr:MULTISPECIES: NUDIX domain-containing protein [unclassified Rhizobium]MBD9445119.1 NUDIX domain-containing protein [Rhizobium sp. RHZ01]MBD9454432.1 NUDIX domain-containing protein [Rhizobium sp. RHZ02]NMN71397.1 8-oxo-dGTP pyrophosphatase MutT (NUDIX family) [Rhizobium sp. 57MFTsu3.2]